MSSGLRAAALRLPAWALEIEQLTARNESFRSMCDDLAAAESALNEVNRLPETVREERRREYQSISEGLVAEIEEALRTAKVVPIAGPKRHPEH